MCNCFEVTSSTFQHFNLFIQDIGNTHAIINLHRRSQNIISHMLLIFKVEFFLGVKQNFEKNMLYQ